MKKRNRATTSLDSLTPRSHDKKIAKRKKQGADPTQRIGPIPVTIPRGVRKRERFEDVEAPVTADMNDPLTYKLAALIGWKRVFELEQESKQAHEYAKLMGD